MFEWAEFGHHLDCENVESEFECNQLILISKAMRISTFISFLSSSSVMLLFIYFRNESVMRKFAYHLIFFIVLMDIIFETSILAVSNLDAHSYQPTCVIAGCMAQFAAISSNLWMLVISYTIYDSTRGYKTWVPQSIHKIHTFIWTFSGISTVLPLITMSYGPAGGWCWIKQETSFDIIWRFAVFYIPTCTIIFSVCFMFFWILKDFGLSNPIMRRMGIFPALVIFGWSVGTANRVVQLFHEGIWQIALAHAITVGLHGTANSTIFLITPGMRKLLGYCPAVEVISKSRSVSVSEDMYSYTAFADSEDERDDTAFDSPITFKLPGDLPSINLSSRYSDCTTLQSTRHSDCTTLQTTL